MAATAPAAMAITIATASEEKSERRDSALAKSVPNAAGSRGSASRNWPVRNPKPIREAAASKLASSSRTAAS